MRGLIITLLLGLGVWSVLYWTWIAPSYRSPKEKEVIDSSWYHVDEGFETDSLYYSTDKVNWNLMHVSRGEDSTTYNLMINGEYLYRFNRTTNIMTIVKMGSNDTTVQIRLPK